MAARLAGLIDRHGESVGIYRKSSGAVDGYGDAAVTWSLAATEFVLIKPFNPSMGSQLENNIDVAGRLKDVVKLGYAKSDSVAVQDDYLLAGSEKWRVLLVSPFKVGNTTRIKILCLSRFT